MKKYWVTFKISFQQEFAYPANFIMWRVRNIMQLLLLFFLWDAILPTSQNVILGYNRSMILTYVLLAILLRSLVLSSKSYEITGDITQGTLSNYLIKPFSYLKYWFSRDMASKALNICFGTIEFIILYLLLKPPIFLQTDWRLILIFLLALVFAIVIFFFLILLFVSITFIYPENSWGYTFILLIFTEFLGGGLFPIDILPFTIQRVILATPFPYLIFVPMQIYLGKYSFDFNARLMLMSGVWMILLFFVVGKVWKWGVKKYRAEGK